jgi:hypothetical protein
MWNLLKKNRQGECGMLRDSLEAAKLTDAMSMERLTEGLSQPEQGHFISCESCQEAAQDIVSAREMFHGIPSSAEDARSEFAARVMNAIAAREREIALRINTWTEFPRFASRLAWITAAVLLASTTWFYERVVRAPTYPSNSPAQESIFETSPQTNQDDILISMSESKP